MNPPNLKTIAEPRSRKEIINIVNRIKDSFEMKSMFFPVCKFLEILPVVDETLYLEYVENKELPSNTYAYYDPVNNLMMIDEEVYLRACNGVARDRFTIAHEIGHYFLVDKVMYTRKSDEKIPAYCDPEWQANAFASELLMPSRKILHMPVSSIVRECKVSYQAAEIALKNAKKSSYLH